MHCAVHSWTKRALWGLSEPSNLLRPSRASRGRAAHEEGEGPTCAAPHKLAHKKTGTQRALLAHTKQEKSVFVAQLSLSTTK